MDTQEDMIIIRDLDADNIIRNDDINSTEENIIIYIGSNTKNTLKTCYIPTCKNNTDITPNKTFFEVPEKNRQEWIKAAGIVRKLPAGLLFICEDHLDLQEDLENYETWKRNESKPQLRATVPKYIKSLQLAVTSVYVKEPRTPRSGSEPNKKPKISPDNAPLNNNSEKNENLDKSNTERIENIEPTTIIVIQQEDIENILENPTVEKEIIVSHENMPQVPGNAIIISVKEDLPLDIPAVNETGKDLSGRDFLLTNIMINPVFYLGLPEHAYWIISHISKNLPHVHLSVIITLFKIKTDDALIRLSDEFQVSDDRLKLMYTKTVNLLAYYLKPLIQWPKEPIKNATPIRFLNQNKEFVNIQCILDVFEIEIDKPLDAKRVIPIWSTEKKCPTMKFLIAATPDGTISFVSKGYRGGMSDVMMLTNSGFLDILPKNCTVLTNRSFKGLGKSLSDKSVTLITLPPENLESTPCITKSSLANLRSPVERILRKIKEFNHLAPHSAVNEYFITFLDKAVIIACGLINLQSFEVSEDFKKTKGFQ